MPNRPYYDVRDYGAVGDGVTDDTAAIQAAFDARLVRILRGRDCSWEEFGWEDAMTWRPDAED